MVPSLSEGGTPGGPIACLPANPLHIANYILTICGVPTFDIVHFGMKGVCPCGLGDKSHYASLHSSVCAEESQVESGRE